MRCKKLRDILDKMIDISNELYEETIDRVPASEELDVVIDDLYNVWVQEKSKHEKIVKRQKKREACNE